MRSGSSKHARAASGASRLVCEQRSDRLGEFFNGLIVLRGDGLNQVSRQRDAGRDRQTLARGVAESDRLGPKE